MKTVGFQIITEGSLQLGRDSLHAQRFQTLMRLLFENRWVSD